MKTEFIIMQVLHLPVDGSPNTLVVQYSPLHPPGPPDRRLEISRSIREWYLDDTDVTLSEAISVPRKTS